MDTCGICVAGRVPTPLYTPDPDALRVVK
ncbi:hypothetical protein KIPB_011430, partial [Kipferlia bialata]|eukprot:g11430.t1